MVPFISSTVITLAVSMASISLAHALSTSSSACDIVFTHSFVYPSGPGDLFAFKQLSTKLLNSLSVTLPLSLALGSILVLLLNTPALKRKLMSATFSLPWRRCVCCQHSSQKPVSCLLDCSCFSPSSLLATMTCGCLGAQPCCPHLAAGASPCA